MRAGRPDEEPGRPGAVLGAATEPARGGRDEAIRAIVSSAPKMSPQRSPPLAGGTSPPLKDTQMRGKSSPQRSPPLGGGTTALDEMVSVLRFWAATEPAPGGRDDALVDPEDLRASGLAATEPAPGGRDDVWEVAVSEVGAALPQRSPPLGGGTTWQRDGSAGPSLRCRNGARPWGAGRPCSLRPRAPCHRGAATEPAPGGRDDELVRVQVVYRRDGAATEPAPGGRDDGNNSM